MAKPAALKTALLALLLCAGACARKEELVIYATGRSQGRIWARGGEGGFAVLKALYDGEKSPKIALDLGNWSSSEPEGWFTKGRSAVDCLAALPYAAAAVGTEELALTPQELQGLAEASPLPILASNLYLKSNKKPGFLHSWRVVQAGGRKVGVFALLIHSPPVHDRQKYLPNYKLEKATYEAERAMKALKDNGAGLTVMLLGVNPKEHATQDFYRDLLTKLPKVDLVITDEPSLKKPFKIKRTWVAPAGLELARAARLSLRLDPATGKLKDLKWKSLALSKEKYGEAPEMLRVIETHRKAVAAHFGRRIGFLQTPLPLRDGPLSPAADFAADCMRRWARTNAAIIGLAEPAAGFSSGPVTTGDLHKAYPQESSVVFVKIRGDDLERALTGLRPGDITVSGLKLFMRDGLLERAETETGPLIPGRVYQLAVPDSLVSGRDNPVLSSAMEFANSRRRLREVIGWCFSLRSSFSGPAGGRVVKAEEK